MSEFDPLLVEALQSLEQRITATEVVQQLLVASWRSLNPESAKALSQTLKNVATSEEVEANGYCRKYLSHMAEHLGGNLDVPIWGLSKPDTAPDQASPIPRLRLVVDDGKPTSA